VALVAKRGRPSGLDTFLKTRQVWRPQSLARPPSNRLPWPYWRTWAAQRGDAGHYATMRPLFKGLTIGGREPQTLTPKAFMAIPSYKAVLKHYASVPADVQKYFSQLPPLIQNFNWDVCIAYQFIGVETAQNRILYGGVVKLHRADAYVADSMLYSLHVTRASFLELVANIFGKPLPDAVANKLKFAEGVRDKTVHGKGIAEAEARQALVDVLDYATEMNKFIEGIAGFRPFGDMRGFKGAAQPLEKSTTHWLLKGLGF
jgi:hypothetical protein